MGTFILIAVRNLLQARRRTVLLSVALGGVTLLLVLLMSLSQGLQDTMVHSATTLVSGHVNVGGWYKSSSRDMSPILVDVSEVRRVVEEGTPGVDHVVDRSHAWAKIVSESSSMFVSLSGVDFAEEVRFLERIRLAPQSAYVEGAPEVPEGDLGSLTEPGSILLFESQARRLGVRVGDVLTMVFELPGGVTNTGDVRVAAVARDVGFMSSWNAYVPKESVRTLYHLKPGTSGSVLVYLDDISRADATLVELRELFEGKGYQVLDHDPNPFWMKFETIAGQDWLGQRLDLTTWEDQVSFLQYILTAIDTVSFVLITILVIIIGIGIMNTMLIAVRERTREIGTLRAIGMSRRRVLGMFLVEALVLGLFASAVGALVGAGIAATVNAAAIPVPSDAVKALLMSDVLHLAVRPGQVVQAVVGFTVITALAALWPALRASRLQPITAIHHLG